MNDSLSHIAEALSKAGKIALLSHYNPDADAYGSSCGLALALRALGKQTQVINESGAIRRFDYIPGVSEVKDAFDPDAFDAVVVCDCGDPPRVGDRLVSLLPKCKLLVNLDHHISNEGFGSLNHVKPDKSSTSEIVFDLIETAGWKLTKEIALALFAGLMGDTGSFRYASTTAATFEAARKLVEAGASPPAAADGLYGRASLAAVRLHAEALASLNLYANGRVCELVVTEQMLRRCGATSDDTENLVEKGRDIEGVRISYLVRWDEMLWRISLRSKLDDCDLSKLAQSFGGGGHKQAAAFRWRKPFDELMPRLRRELEQLCNDSLRD